MKYLYAVFAGLVATLLMLSPVRAERLAECIPTGEAFTRAVMLKAAHPELMVIVVSGEQSVEFQRAVNTVAPAKAIPAEVYILIVTEDGTTVVGYIEDEAIGMCQMDHFTPEETRRIVDAANSDNPA